MTNRVVSTRLAARVGAHWALALLASSGCSAPSPAEPDPERIFADERLQGPDGTPLAPFPTSVFGLGFGRNEFELSRDCEAAGGQLHSSETWYGPAPVPEPWTCLELPAPGLGSGRFRRVTARFCDRRACELVFSGMALDPATALAALLVKYGPPAVRTPPVPCAEDYGYDFARESSTVAWSWRAGGQVRATIVVVQTCDAATLVYTDLTLDRRER